jgi:hypothetical protein
VPALLAALDAFLQEHRRCGELNGSLDGAGVCGSRARGGRRFLTGLPWLLQHRHEGNPPACERPRDDLLGVAQSSHGGLRVSENRSSHRASHPAATSPRGGHTRL